MIAEANDGAGNGEGMDHNPNMSMAFRKAARLMAALLSTLLLVAFSCLGGYLNIYELLIACLSCWLFWSTAKDQISLNREHERVVREMAEHDERVRAMEDEERADRPYVWIPGMDENDGVIDGDALRFWPTVEYEPWNQPKIPDSTFLWQWFRDKFIALNQLGSSAHATVALKILVKSAVIGWALAAMRFFFRPFETVIAREVVETIVDVGVLPAFFWWLGHTNSMAGGESPSLSDAQPRFRRASCLVAVVVAYVSGFAAERFLKVDLLVRIRDLIT